MERANRAKRWWPGRWHAAIGKDLLDKLDEAAHARSRGHAQTCTVDKAHERRLWVSGRVGQSAPRSVDLTPTPLAECPAVGTGLDPYPPSLRSNGG